MNSLSSFSIELTQLVPHTKDPVPSNFDLNNNDFAENRFKHRDIVIWIQLQKLRRGGEGGGGRSCYYMLFLQEIQISNVSRFLNSCIISTFQQCDTLQLYYLQCIMYIYYF